jgi:hypothetical protein
LISNVISLLFLCTTLKTCSRSNVFNKTERERSLELRTEIDKLKSLQISDRKRMHELLALVNLNGKKGGADKQGMVSYKKSGVGHLHVAGEVFYLFF